MRRALAALSAHRAWLDAELAAMPPEVDPALDPPLAEALASCRRLQRDDVKAARLAVDAAHEALRAAHAGVRAAALAPPLLALVADAEHAYRAAKARRGALDFADLLARARDLLVASPAARSDTRARFDAVLVDEFQDTNHLQKRLLELARAPDAPRLVVGDPKQSIYEFRGADVSVFGAVERETAAAGGQVLALTESFRGRAPLVELLNRLFARAMRGGDQPFEIAFDAQADALAPVRGPGESEPRVWRLDPDTTDAAISDTPEADAVAALVHALVVAEPRPLVFDKHDEAAGPRQPRFGDVAILLRRFTHLDDHLAALRRLGIPHYVVGGRGFHEAQEVRDLAHALTLLDDPDDNLALLGVLRSPLVGLGDAALVALAELAPRKAGGRPGALALRPLLASDPPASLAPDEASRLSHFLATYRRLRRHADRLGAAGTLDALIDAVDLRAVLAAAPYGEQRLANLEQLVELARAHDEGGEPRARFTRTLRAQVGRERSLAAPAQVLGEREDVVRLMTVHQAKGLEFPVVIVPECGAPERDDSPQVAYDRAAGLGVRVRCADGAYADSPRAAAALALRRARGQAESLRLFYVACTRARDLLVLSGRARKSGGTWLAHLDDLVAADPAAAALVRAAQPSAPPAAAPAPAPAEAEPAMLAGAPLSDAAVDAQLCATLAARLGPPATGAATITAPVTELADFDACARRYRLKHELGLEEHPSAPESGRLPVIRPIAPPAPPPAALVPLALDDLIAPDPRLDPGPLDAVARGTLAHHVLERLDLPEYLARGAAAIDEALAREGHDAPLSPEATRVRAAVLAFLATPFGRALAARDPATFAREESFVFSPRGADAAATRLLLKGQMDLVLHDADAVVVLDYKLARAASSRDYRFQLAAYAAAARALWRRPVRVGLVYLLDARPEPVLHELADAELDAVEARLSSLAARLAAARRAGAFSGKPLPECRALACGYASRCHALPPGAPPRAPRKSRPGGQLRLGDGVEGW
jgi:ATP-dependent exoDNAse (exonuclease V) beta subunit